MMLFVITDDIEAGLRVILAALWLPLVSHESWVETATNVIQKFSHCTCCLQQHVTIAVTQ